MPTGLSWINPLRAASLATLILTRHEGVDVIPVRQAGYDLLVRIRSQRTAGEPEFGVEVKGTRRWNPTGNGTSVEVNLDGFADVRLPLLLFLFDVVRDEGFYQWMREPVVDADGNADLLLNPMLRRSPVTATSVAFQGDAFRVLNNRAVDEIICRVVEWHKARDGASPSAEIRRRAG